jgi:hypothetical protein
MSYSKGENRKVYNKSCLGVVVTGGGERKGGYNERLKEAECSGNIMYSYMKI